MLEAINGGLAAQHAFGPGEATEAAKIMETNDELMLAEGIFYIMQ